MKIKWFLLSMPLLLSGLAFGSLREPKDTLEIIMETMDEISAGLVTLCEPAGDLHNKRLTLFCEISSHNRGQFYIDLTRQEIDGVTQDYVSMLERFHNECAVQSCGAKELNKIATYLESTRQRLREYFSVYKLN